jgi:hypothetical protein
MNCSSPPAVAYAWRWRPTNFWANGVSAIPASSNSLRRNCSVWVDRVTMSPLANASMKASIDDRLIPVNAPALTSRENSATASSPNRGSTDE